MKITTIKKSLFRSWKNNIFPKNDASEVEEQLIVDKQRNHFQWLTIG